MQLPKLYHAVKIKFWSLRNGIGEGMGVIFDIDTEVERKCMRVLIPNGWKWQIVNFDKMLEWDYLIETDKECLEEIGQDINEIEILTKCKL